MERECKRCGNVCTEIKQKGTHIGAYCSECGKWIKWLKKDELTANDEIKEIQTLIGKMGKELSGKGIGFISELIKEYGFSEVYKLECFNELYRGKIRKILMENYTEDYTEDYTEEDFDELKTVFCNTTNQHELLDDLNIYYSLV